jgi:hypothetical protein
MAKRLDKCHHARLTHFPAKMNRLGKFLKATLQNSLFRVGLAIIGIGNIAQASDLTVEGTISYKIYSSDGNVRMHQLDDFSLSVQECNWYIKKVPVLFERAGKKERLTGTTEVSSDTKNFYQLTDLGDTGKNPAPKVQFFGRVGSGPAPFNLSDPKLIALWYSYASSCYLKEAADRNEHYVIPPTVLGTGRVALLL